MADPTDTQDLQAVWSQYSNNIVRQAGEVARHFQATLMHHLQHTCGFHELRLSYEPLLGLPGRKGIGVSELAHALGISRQSCNQQLNAVEKAGLIQRQADPTNARAKRVILTPRGQQVVQAGTEQLVSLDCKYRQALAPHSLDKTANVLWQLATTLELPTYRSANTTRGLSVEDVRFVLPLPRFARYMQNRLLDFTRAKGHQNLQASYRQVFNYIGLHGVSLQQLAHINDVSKQSLVRVVNQLEHGAYIKRYIDPRDTRSKKLMLTQRGISLMRDENLALAELRTEIVALSGERNIKELEKSLSMLCQHYHLCETIDAGETDLPVFPLNSNSDYHNLTETTDPAALLVYLAWTLDKEGSITRRVGRAETGSPLQLSERFIKSLGNTVIDENQLRSQLDKSLGKRGAARLHELIDQLGAL